MPDLSDQRDLGAQLRDYVDGIAPGITRDEVTRVHHSLVLDPPPAADPHRRRAWVALVAVAAAAAVIGALLVGLRTSERSGRVDTDPATTPGPPPSPTSVSPPTGPQPDFEVLGMRARTEWTGQLISAVDESTYGALWQLLGFRVDDRPDVDFTRWIVVSITIPDDACPPALDGFDRDGSTWTPRFVEPLSPCRQPLIPKTFVVAINRAEVTPAFTLHLTDALTQGSGEQSMLVEVPRLGSRPDNTGPIVTGTTQPALAQVLSRSPLTESWGCGTSFAVTNAEHTVAVFLRATTPPPAGSSTVTLADPDWVAELQLGHDLYTVACQDQDLRSNPEPTDRWPLSQGTITLTTPTTRTCGNPEPATAVLEHGTLRGPDLATIGLTNISITHHDWGCAAG